MNTRSVNAIRLTASLNNRRPWPGLISSKLTVHELRRRSHTKARRVGKFLQASLLALRVSKVKVGGSLSAFVPGY